MLKSKVWFSLVLLLVLSMLLAVGCAQPDVAPDPDVDVPADDDVPEAPVDGVVVTIAAGAVGMELELTRDLAEMYMDDNPGVIVNVLDTPDMVEGDLAR